MKKYVKKFVELPNGEKIAYLEEGKGSKIIVLIHGNMSSSIHWTPLIEKLEDEYKIVAIDMRGFGDSSYNKRFDSLDELADDVASFCKVVGIKDFAAAGWSTGGGVVMSLAARYPGLVNKIVLVDSMSYLGFPVFKKDEKGVPQLGAIYGSKDEMAADPVQVAPAVKCIEDKNFAFMDYLWNLTIYTGAKKPSAEDNQIYLAETFKERCLVDVDWSLSVFNMSNNPGYYSAGNGLVEKINVPVICFWGEKDITVPEFMTQQNAMAFKNFELHVIKNSGHSPLVDDIDTLAEGFRKAI